MTTSWGNMPRGRLRPQAIDAEWREAHQRWTRLSRLEEALPREAIERFRWLRYEEVAAEAKAVEARYSALARAYGFARTRLDTADDDWLKLASELEWNEAQTVADLPYGGGERWARRMAAHALEPQPHADAVGLARRDSQEDVHLHDLLVNWLRRRLLRQRIAPLLVPGPSPRRRRRLVRQLADGVPADSRERVLARALTARFNALLPWYAKVEVIAVPSGWALTVRWGLKSWGISECLPEEFEDDPLGVIELLSDLQSFVASSTRTAWPLDIPADGQDWITAWPEPGAAVVENQVRLWYGPEDEPVLELEPINLGSRAPGTRRR